MQLIANILYYKKKEVNRVNSVIDDELEFDYLDIDYSIIRNKKLEEEKYNKEVLLTDTLEISLEEIENYE